MPDPMTPRPSRAEVERERREDVVRELVERIAAFPDAFTSAQASHDWPHVETLARTFAANVESLARLARRALDGAAPKTGEPVACATCGAKNLAQKELICEAIGQVASRECAARFAPPVATPPSSPEARDNMLTFWDLPNSEQREVVARWIESEGLLETAVAIRSIGDVRNAEAAARAAQEGGTK